ncbi:hypothetical protein pb186bvf_009980 [Paramecium bursaria]
MRRILRQLYNFATYESSYGQAGKLTFDLKHKNNVVLNTIWEDKTVVQTTNNNFNFYEDGRDCVIQSTGDGDVIAQIPEYYSFTGNVEGNLKHSYLQVDPKIYGEVNIDVKGAVDVNKIKSDNTNIKAFSINIQKYLETQSGSLIAQSDIEIKKLAIVKDIKLQTTDGKVNIGSFYSQLQDIQPIKQDEIQSQVLKLPHLKLISHSSKVIKIGYCQGGVDIKSKSRSLKLKMISNGIFHIENIGTVEIGISEKAQGYVKSDEKVIVNILQDSPVNIIYNGLNEQLLKDLGNIYIDSPELEINYADNVFGL